MDSIEKTEKMYGFLWKRDKNVLPPKRWHFNSVQETIDEPIVRGSMGIDVGSGCGYDTYIMAKHNPSVNIISVDLSDGVYETRDLTSNLDNVKIIKCSILNIPLKDNIFDFAYSFGVLHHTSNPKKGLLEIVRILKRNSPAFLYLYEDHSENFIKYVAVKIISKLRKITVRMSPKSCYVFSWALSPFVFVTFSLPTKMLRMFKATRHFADKIPFNFGTGPFSLRWDLYDRFNAPIEHRFNRQGLYDIFSECGFQDVSVTKLKHNAGWVVWGYKR